MMKLNQLPTPAHTWSRRRNAEHGLTLVELLVAVGLSTLIALAAVAALVVSRRGFTSVDAASQLRDNARFATSMIQRVTVQAGFQDWQFLLAPRKEDGSELANPPPNISGFNNSVVTSSTDPIGTAANNSRSGACNSAAGGGCSDILIVRYQPQSVSGTALVDNSVIDCGGAFVGFSTGSGPGTLPAASRDDQGISIFHVDIVKGEPTLLCTAGTQKVVGGVAQTASWSAPVPVVQGVENFQVLYGTDGVTAGVGVTSATAPTGVPDRYLRADQIVVAGNAAATNDNWRRVRSVRIGMVLRGPTGSQQEFASQTFYPFGLAVDASSGGTPGFAMSTTDAATSADKGTRYASPTDGRLRQTATFTVYMHNDLGLCLSSECKVQAP